RDIDIALIGERLVPRRRTRRALSGPGSEGDALNRLHRDAPIATTCDQRLGVSRVGRVAQLRRVVREEDAIEREALEALAMEPRRDVELGVAVTCRGVDVIEVVAKHKLERAICLSFAHAPERSGAEERAPTLVAGRAEWRARDHPARVPTWRRPRLECRRAKRGPGLGAEPPTGDVMAITAAPKTET